jgi:hypothetical protein
MGEIIMNVKSLTFTFLLGACCMLSGRSFAQTDSVRVINEKQTAIENNERNTDRLKSEVLKNETLKNDAQMTQQERDKTRLSEAENLHKDNKARAKAANRLSRDASDAARESKLAARSERRAQKSRADADKQASKAAKATRKSEKN